MTPDRRTAEIVDEHRAETLPIDTIAMRRSDIVECTDAHDRFALALALAIHKPVSIATARLVLSAAPTGMTHDEAHAWAARVVEPDKTSIGVTHGH